MRYIEINDERYNKGLRVRYRVFNELEYSETKVICRNAVCANIKQSRIITIPNIDHVKHFSSINFLLILSSLNSIG